MDYLDKNTNTLLLPFDLKFNPAYLMGFIPKDETHVTIIGHTAGKIITEELSKFRVVLRTRFKNVVKEYLDLRSSVSWTHNTNRLHIVQKVYDSGENRTSLILMLEEDSAHTKFVYQMEALFPGISEHLSIPHVTLGVDDKHPGIAITPHTWDNELKNKFNVYVPREAQGRFENQHSSGSNYDYSEYY